MTRIQYSHHQEQMEAYRRDFQIEFAPRRETLKKAGVSERGIIFEETFVWTLWLAKKRKKVPTQGEL